MYDKTLGYLQEARASALDDSAKSRELSLVITKIDEAILWRQHDLFIKQPPMNEKAE